MLAGEAAEMLKRLLVRLEELRKLLVAVGPIDREEQGGTSVPYRRLRHTLVTRVSGPMTSSPFLIVLIWRMSMQTDA
jgi:hypothetical protein